MRPDPHTFLVDPDLLVDPDWWRDAVVYQVYPRAFVDSTGSGIGDLEGVRSRIGYLRDLGVDALWLSPFYPSRLVDGGYDVDDYRDVDPSLGSLATFDALVRDAHAAGLRVIVDIVPNHSSSRHVWFREALASTPGSAARARYIFRPGLGEGSRLPPNGWQSLFGGSAWQPVGDGDWYLHLFAVEQPDFDWSNREVRDEFLTTLAFWADRGVDGFRVDVAHGLAKDLSPRESLGAVSMGPVGAVDAAEPARRSDGTDPLFDRDDVHAIFAEWRQLFDTYTPPRSAVAEAWVAPHRRALYARPSELGQAFEFALLEAPWSAAAFETAIRENLALSASVGSSSTWVLSNHDVVRHASRYGLPNGSDLPAWLMSNGLTPVEDLGLGVRRARAATLLTLALPGSSYLYQGEELGLPEVADLPVAALQDPIWSRTNGVRKGRDGSRVALPWTRSGPSFGFGVTPAVLPQPDWFGSLSVEAQSGVHGSTLSMYREALALRRSMQRDAVVDVRADGEVLYITRSDGFTSVTNFGVVAIALPEGRVCLGSASASTVLEPSTTVWLQVGGIGEHQPG
ncbi:alpha-amylase [Cryobacterium melibiosiphilum]|uniref:Alpha-amylase n=1 Tax=Cryobacterium melibiosiphilum TaxID=995039 RepID=A0A3A5MM68_9MICO|nr:glycoside hydrolase family 13 protein [Cryobacterium melibiosiphilum]RJT90462.1 alpha-amylase [Cryobacterium melibiosiphilum]